MRSPMAFLAFWPWRWSHRRVERGRAGVRHLHWQLQPYCNRVTLTVVAGTFRLDGVDDQCGAATQAGATGHRRDATRHQLDLEHDRRTPVGERCDPAAGAYTVRAAGVYLLSATLRLVSGSRAGSTRVCLRQRRVQRISVQRAFTGVGVSPGHRRGDPAPSRRRRGERADAELHRRAGRRRRACSPTTSSSLPGCSSGRFGYTTAGPRESHPLTRRTA